jgi:hypothetical protein
LTVATTPRRNGSGRRAGVVDLSNIDRQRRLLALVPVEDVWGVAQLNLFDENAPRAGSDRLMEVLDHLNAKDGKGTLYFAGQGIQQQWQMKREMLSPRYTTRFSDLLRIR